MEFFKLSRVKFGFAFASWLLLSACSFLPPFVDRQRNAGVHDISKLYVGESTPEEPAVCYNGWTTTYEEVKKLAQRVKGILVPELNAGQMIEDVRLAVDGAVRTEHFGRLGGIVPTPDEILNAFYEKIYEK